MTAPIANPKTRELSRRSVAILFAVGAIMLVAPLSTVLYENSNCKTDSYSCIHSKDYGYLVSSFPYVMLGGGLLIGFNMKRISDTLNSHSPNENEEEEEDDDSVASVS